MFEFESFIYLDVPKTGSTFIRALLRRHCRDREIRGRPHIGLSSNYDRSKFCFISIRNPLDQYISLYSFGCDSSGHVYERMKKQGAQRLYDGTWEGFQEWLKFVLAPDHAECLARDYALCGEGRVCSIVGFQSYRMLSLAIPNAHSLLGSCEDRNAVREIYRSAKAHNSIVRHENFRSDLTRLLKVELMSRVIDLDEAIRFVETQKPMNSSKRSLGREKFHGLESGLRELLREREWFLCEEFSYAFDQAEAAA